MIHIEGCVALACSHLMYVLVCTKTFYETFGIRNVMLELTGRS